MPLLVVFLGEDIEEDLPLRRVVIAVCCKKRCIVEVICYVTRGRHVLERVLPGRITPNKSTIAPSQCTHISHICLHDPTSKKWRVIKFTYVQMDIFLERMRRTRGYASLDKFKFNGSDRSCAVLLDVRMVHPAVFQLIPYPLFLQR